MKLTQLFITAACTALLSGCASNPPIELVNAREAYRRASTGPAAQAAPAEVHLAHQALTQAEQSFKEDSDSYQTRDLSYVAQRKSELAEATASIAIEQKKQVRASDEYKETQGNIYTQAKQDLSQTRTALAVSEHQGEMAAERLSSEQAARSSADQRATNAQDARAGAAQRTADERVGAEKRTADAESGLALARLGAVQEEARGRVITLASSMLFASGQATLLADARTRLNQVAEVLLATPERNLVIEGHTDSRGSDRENMELSQRRAEAVRDYLVNRGYQANRVHAHGHGEENPIADNTNAEGRANNRRVEIVVQPVSHSSNP